jgi:transcriptional regulator with XRE-family HTH domain
MTPVRKLRNRLYLKQPQFARLLAMSVRTLAALESGSAPTESIARRLTEIERLTNALAEVIERTSIGEWLQKPNPAFDGLKPLEVIERGEGDRLWQMIYYLRSGIPA